MSTEVTVETDESEESSTPEVVVVETGDSSDVVQEATLIAVVDRLARIEEHQSLMAEAVTALEMRVESLQMREDMQDERIEQAVETTVELAQDVPEIAEDVADTTTAEHDEPPTSKEHWFYKKWGKP